MKTKDVRYDIEWIDGGAKNKQECDLSNEEMEQRKYELETDANVSDIRVSVR